MLSAGYKWLDEKMHICNEHRQDCVAGQTIVQEDEVIYDDPAIVGTTSLVEKKEKKLFKAFSVFIIADEAVGTFAYEYVTCMYIKSCFDIL